MHTNSLPTAQIKILWWNLCILQRMLSVQGCASWTCCNVAPFKPHSEGINTNIFLWTVGLQDPSCICSSLCVFSPEFLLILEAILTRLSKGTSAHHCVLSCASWCSLYTEETAPLLPFGKHKASKYTLVPVPLTGGEGSNFLHYGMLWCVLLWPAFPSQAASSVTL